MGRSAIHTYTVAVRTTSNNTVSTLLSVALAVMVYLIAALFTRAASEDDLMMMPMGVKAIRFAKNARIKKIVLKRSGDQFRRIA